MRSVVIFSVFIFSFSILYSQTSIPPASGDGSVSNPYQIATLDNLYWLSQQAGVENATAPYWAKYYLQTANIDASSSSGWDSGAGFSPIGNPSSYFTGSYDGGGFTIDGLAINRPASSNMGFLGANTGTISNVNLINVSISGGAGSGGLIGFSSGAPITNCSVSGSVVGSDAYIGILIGHHQAGSISNSYSSGTVNGTHWVGGLVGYNSSSASITNCYSNADVTCLSVGGGLVGNNDSSTINNCYSRGNVTRPSGANTQYGAFCGENNHLIEYCYSTGSVYYNDTNPTDKGFIGYDNTGPGSYYVNNFWSSQISNQTTAIGATNITLAQMKDHTTFTAVGWDFEIEAANGLNNWWDIDYSPPPPGKIRSTMDVMAFNDGYPFLSWENGDDVALPVKLTSFTVESTSKGVQCSWTTESEIENLGFILERKTEETGWNEIASYKTDNNLQGQGTVSFPTDYEYLDALIGPNTTYDYRLADVDHDGKVTYHSVRTVTTDKYLLASKAEKFTVLPAYPNPFNPSTTIQYGLDRDSKVSIQIYDITGQLIKTLLDTEQHQGWHTTLWNGTDNFNKQVPAGIYMSRISSNNITKSMKLMLLK